MTEHEFRAARKELGLSQIDLGRIHLGKSVRAVRRYEAGTVEIPALVSEKVVELVDAKRTADAKTAKKAARA